jgi:nucleoside-diphosphate-sugar epimerase
LLGTIYTKDKMNIAITGATGFIGKHLVNYLSSKSEYRVNVLAQSNEVNPFLGQPNIIFTTTDFSKDNLTSCLQEIDRVIHLAGVRMPRAKEYVSLEYFFEGNIKLLENVVLSAIKCNVKRVLFSSSIAVYGDSENHMGLSEEDQLNPLNNYGLSKLIGEQVLTQLTKCYGIETVSMRFSQIFGKGERPDLIMANFINKCEHNEEISIHSSGFHERDYLYVDDAIKAIELIVNKDYMSGIFNIGSNTSMSAFKIAETIKKQLNSRSSIITSPQPSKVSKLFMSTNKIRQELGWVPKWTIEEAVQEMCK